MERKVVDHWLDRLAQARAESSWGPAVVDKTAAREVAAKSIRELHEGFVSGRIGLESFRDEFDRRSRVEWGAFGLGGFGGGMFLNKLVKYIRDHGRLQAELLLALAVPSGEEAARLKLYAFTRYLEGLVTSGAATRGQVDLARATFFCPVLWHVHEPEAWPIFYQPSRRALASSGALPSEAVNPDAYVAFRSAFRDLQQQLAVDRTTLESLLNWQPPSRATPGPSPVAGAATPNVWLIAPGEGARLWDEFREKSIVAIGWDGLGNLANRDYESIVDMLSRQRTDGIRPSHDARACHNFVHVMRPGDILVAKRGRAEVVGYGVVESDYRFEPKRAEYRHVRSARWTHAGSWRVREKPLVTKTLTNITEYAQLVDQIQRAIGVAETEVACVRTGATSPVPPYGMDDACRDLFMPRGAVERALRLLRRRKNIILQGPPGVGKTFVAHRLALLLLGETDPTRVQWVQFHQSYTYEHFVRGYRPTAEGGFVRADGPFLTVCDDAHQDPASAYVLIIDEINRGNLSKILGDLMMLIEPDKRTSTWSRVLTYTEPNEKDFFVPPNLHIIGTMNTADRSLSLVDYALRRRFAFVDLEPAYGASGFGDHLEAHGATAELVRTLREGLDRLNRIISDDPQLGPGFRIGHSHFVLDEGQTMTEELLGELIETEITPLLREYWYDARERADEACAMLFPAD